MSSRCRLDHNEGGNSISSTVELKIFDWNENPVNRVQGFREADIGVWRRIPVNREDGRGPESFEFRGLEGKNLRKVGLVLN
jgi:hypothetical protein